VPDRPANESALRACPIFAGIGDADLASLAEGSFMAYAEGGETIWRAGVPSGYCAVLAVGFVKLTRMTPEGRVYSVEVLGPGQVFGLLSAIEDVPFPLSATAASNCWYLKMPRAALMEVYERSSSLKDGIIHSLGPRFRRSLAMTSRFSRGPVEARIAAVLLSLAESYGSRCGDGVALTLRLSTEELGRLASATADATSRVLSKWARAKLVQSEGDRLRIIQPDALSALVHR
jgi:CRP-like cAMP-binding protein